MSGVRALDADADVASVELDCSCVKTSQMGFTHFYVDRKMAGRSK